MAEILSST